MFQAHHQLRRLQSPAARWIFKTSLLCAVGCHLLASTSMATAAESCDGAKPNVRSFATKDELSTELGAAVAAAYAKADPSKPFTVAISGGSLPKLLAAGVVGAAKDSAVAGIKWDNWHVFFADERVVALDNDDSNYKSCQEKLFGPVGIPAANVHTIGDPSQSAEAVAQAYEKDLASVFGEGVPAFDLVLLGMGPDGHTASLFPGHPLLDVTDKFVAHIEDSPKLPPKRITLTYPVLNAAKTTFFVCTGGGKAPNLAKILATGDDLTDALPAARIRPASRDLVWFVDDDASADWRASL